MLDRLNMMLSGATLSGITIPYGHLAYDKDYYIEIDVGALKNANNENYLAIIDDTICNFSTSGSCTCPSLDNCDLLVNLQ
jgi:delta-aminolevulinic acid dehydratase/porphobilinogen synthase